MIASKILLVFASVLTAMALLPCSPVSRAAQSPATPGVYLTIKDPADNYEKSVPNRPVMHAIRVPDNFIRIDGRDDDWQRLGGVVQKYCLAASGNDHILAPIPARGAVTGPADLSMVASVAYDSNFLYAIADVHDSVLLNYGDASTPWEGDDFEVYVDANPPDSQYADSIDENDGHYTFLPPNINLRYPDGLIFPPDKTAGVRCAARLRPFGYTIECAIPKDLLPNWKAHPDMSSVGFDLQVSDADAPGLVGHDPADKAILFLLHPDFHFKSSLTLGQLVFEPTMTVPSRAMGRPAGRSVKQVLDALNNDSPINAVDLAQDILDRIDDPAIGQIAAAASRSKHPDILRAAGLVYARRRTLAIPADAFPNLVPSAAADTFSISKSGEATYAPAVYADPDDSYYAYALLALAERRQLKPVPLYYNYMLVPDAALRLTFLWCLGIDGDKSIVPELATSYSTSTGQDKLVIAWSLGMLGDPTGAATLSDAAKNDPHSAYGQDAAELLKAFGM